MPLSCNNAINVSLMIKIVIKEEKFYTQIELGTHIYDIDLYFISRTLYNTEKCFSSLSNISFES